jgi:hypothetical protein
MKKRERVLSLLEIERFIASDLYLSTKRAAASDRERE